MSGDNNAPKKGFILFGRDVSQIPCFRESFMYGIGSGLAAGFAFFMFTSRVKRAADVGMFTFVAVTAGYWMHCRYRWTEQRLQYRQLQSNLGEYMAREGTENNDMESTLTQKQPSEPEIVSV